MSHVFHCGLVLLAAGGSRRMGQPKQLLVVGDRPLVRYVTEQALQANVSPVIVVLGAEAERIQPVLADLPVHVATNGAWSEGQGSSLRVGVEAALARSPDLDSLIVALADQPVLAPAHLERLIATYRGGGCSIVASQVGPDRVAPMLFGARHFERLRGIAGDTGARALVKDFASEVATVALPTNADLDTPEDYERFKQARE